MTFEAIDQIPAPIAEFYTVETRQVQQFEDDGTTPVLEEVEYQYTDENGDTQTGSRLEPVFVPVDFVIQVPVLERKTIDDVWRVVALHAGKRDGLVKRFVGMVCRDTQWRFHDEYLTWYEREPMQDDDEFLVFENENIDDTKVFSQELFNAAHQQWQTDEPPKPAKICAEQWFLNNYSLLRKAAFLPLQDQADMQYHDRINGTNTCDEHIESVKRQYPKTKPASNNEEPQKEVQV